MFKYRLTAQCPETGARAGELITPHGVIETPCLHACRHSGHSQSDDAAGT